jgi:4-hydroxybenzoate polyprenyltransferase
MDTFFSLATVLVAVVALFGALFLFAVGMVAVLAAIYRRQLRLEASRPPAPQKFFVHFMREPSVRASFQALINLSPSTGSG